MLVERAWLVKIDNVEFDMLLLVQVALNFEIKPYILDLTNLH